MINTPKILLLSNQATGLCKLKPFIQRTFPERILVIAHETGSFNEKMNWILPDMIVLSISEKDFSGLEAFIQVKDQYPFLPVVFVTDKKDYPHRLIESLDKNSAGVYTMEELSANPDRLNGILEAGNEKNRAFFDHYYRNYDHQIKINKLEHFVWSTKKFRHKNVIFDHLKKLSADINVRFRNSLKLGLTS